ncbi:PQQ-like domain-containing protein [Brevibacterium sandarakinum]|uniref:PQQ-like domain-containing protein n=1 Tax=Brevibacterium sandarakinum TaxID=629680 RepID=A0A1H1TQ40_BRESA|nr:PQQ-binding-like beta-propeller repeat protein [Brevibacterium sandarakinum]SDS62181.1 PQQ-like domain-containing protein [Brevibacterium sandarakinum]
MKRNTAFTVPSAALIALFALSGCQEQSSANGTGSGAGSASTSSAPHGHVEGAEEADEPQLRLAVQDAETGAVSVMDLLSEDIVAEVEGTPDTQLSGADSRYLYLGDGEVGTVTAVDTGVWTTDHGDHKHYYRAEPKTLGQIDGADPAHVVSGSTEVAFFFDGEGRAKIYDRTAFGDGELKQLGTVAPGPHHGATVPFEDHFVSTVPGDKPDDLPSELAVYDAKGKASGIEASCAEIHGTGVTRQGPVFACADGVIRVDDEFNAEVLDYPDEADGARAWSIEVGRDLAAAPFDDGGIGILDAKSGKWTFAATDAEVVSAGVAHDDSAIVALDEEGAVYSLDPETGKVLTKKELVEPHAADDDSAGPSVAVDSERTYVSDPASGTVLELDPADGLREARSFDIGGAPAALAVTGR